MLSSARMTMGGQVCGRFAPCCTCSTPVPCSVELRGIKAVALLQVCGSCLLGFIMTLSGNQGSVLASVCSRRWHDQRCCCPSRD